MKKVKVGIVGAGSWGECHLKAYLSIPHAEVVAVCDSNRDRLDEAAGRYGLNRKYTGINDMLNGCDLDLLSITTHERAHFIPVVTALKSGKHVVLDQPIATNPAAAHEMWKMAVQNRRQLLIVRLNRFLEPYAKLSKAIREERIGRLEQLVFTRSRSEALLKLYHRLPTYYEMLVHDLDLAFWLAGANRLKSMQAFGSKPFADGVRNIERFDFAFGNGVAGTMSNVWTSADESSPLTRGSLEIIGDKGSLTIDTGDISYLVGDPWARQSATVAANDQLQRHVSAALYEQLSAYCHLIAEQSAPDYSSLKQSSHIIDIVDAMTRSIDFHYAVSF
ncbi:Gfo/Idh/MocA family protein [Paenibacillus piri]|uniref:Gfo/Idh/MocA family oxidoreductase n=1 Tax=Paenibacillus piri TaxID=2547395 RepID=A0A4R5KEQ4_9BACL|nr:Gfo/Idh/MocA family oxidoreductase [Paenibacillus piri]TDF93442.1 Gfo/Idh/MocA family oxidoreductase [Paenibacillus piri]